MKQDRLMTEGKMRAFILAAVLAILVMPTAAPAASAQFEVGQPFPQIVLPSLEDGRPTSLSQFRGKKIILHIFASW